ncbi:uncharacterized protein LOC143918641 [Arctopsyche grandis]|uniref:uncharacterized protein LOC143918641 n=1 Tax=Arctopsyche grandis TaxID=121162 RepID=UPI00406D93CC
MESDGYISDLELIRPPKHFRQNVWKNDKGRTNKNTKTDKASDSQIENGDATQTMKLVSEDKKHYIKGMWKNNCLLEIFSCQFSIPKFNENTFYIRKQTPGYLLTMDEENFIARVKIFNLEKFRMLNVFKDVTILRDFFIDGIKVTEIIKDGLLDERNKNYEIFMKCIKDVTNNIGDDVNCAEDCLQIYLETKQSSENISVLQSISDNEHISKNVRDVARRFLHSEESLHGRNKKLPKIENTFQIHTFNLAAELKEMVSQGMGHHKQILFKDCPYTMIRDLRDLSIQQSLYVSKADLKLFSDIISVTNEQCFVNILNNCQHSFIRSVKTFNSSVKEVSPLTRPIYYYLFKSLFELVVTISEKTNCAVEDVLKSIQTKKPICWKSPCFLHTALERQSSFIYQLMSHFNPRPRKKEYEYTFKFLQFNKRKPIWDHMKSVFSKNNDLVNMKEERKIWLCIVDNVMSGENDKSYFELFQPLLLDFVNFVGMSKDDTFEAFRVFTHNIINFMGNTHPYLKNNNLKVDQDILMRQMEHIKNATGDLQYDTIAFENFKNMIEEYNQYWNRRETKIGSIDSKLDYEPHKSRMKAISSKLLQVILMALDKTVNSHSLVQYFRSYNEFLDDFDNIAFDWFVKINKSTSVNGDVIKHVKNKLIAQNISNPGAMLGLLFTAVVTNTLTLEKAYKATNVNDDVIELVKNKLTLEKASYKVKKPKDFVKTGNYPHYIIDIIEKLIQDAIELLNKKQWENGSEFSDNENLLATGLLFSAIRSSFLYFKDQPDYVSFSSFYEESTKPFSNVVQKSDSYKDFEKRLGIIKQSFWYIRKQDEIDIDEALKLFQKLSSNSLSIEDSLKIKTCFKNYLEEYEKCMGECSTKQQKDKIKYIVNLLIGFKTDLKIDQWTLEFKKSTLLQILAHLAALWSVQVSKDIECTQKYLKPHCIQILCILMMLNVGNIDTTTGKCLAQVLTGQGKSVILGLLSSLLAILGNKVRVVCYSEYLAKRDDNDFAQFFDELKIKTRVTYGTFDDMANEVIAPFVNNTKYYLRNLVEKRILHGTKNLSTLNRQNSIGDTILLIDEVDVFFSSEFYGNTHGSCINIEMKAIADMQCAIWKMVKENDYKKITIVEKIEEYIKNEVCKPNEDYLTFEDFRCRPDEYELLVESDGNVIEKKMYTNRSLFSEHLDKMIDCATKVAKGNDTNWYINPYKLNDNGNVCYRRNDGIYAENTICDYYNVFNYFRLKITEFNPNGYNNYGYLTIFCGMTSYANLPQKYSYILGVSGTLTSMNNFEKETVREMYNIKKTFSMPSFFGDCNLKFDKGDDFVVLDSKQTWRDRIQSRANFHIGKERSVLILFETDIEINAFKNEHGSKFDRLNVLTNNTDAAEVERLIEEAAISKTITLATRGMGRGVDYKTSTTVEKNGGVHVIQTFFSLDVKEETQIKGRTARKDNKGSYELILCREALIEDSLVKKSDDQNNTIFINYDSLNEARRIKIDNQGTKTLESVKAAEDNHRTTMEFLDSFFG